jgi:hypothetical protein
MRPFQPNPTQPPPQSAPPQPNQHPNPPQPNPTTTPLSGKQVAQHLRASPPIALLKPCWTPWRGGLLSLDAVVDRLSKLLPPTFEELERDFAVGVVTGDGEHVLIDSGPLPEAVAASAAIPFIFSSVDVPGGRQAAGAGAPTAAASASRRARPADGGGRCGCEGAARGRRCRRTRRSCLGA